MKQKRKYLVVLLLFIILMSLVLVFFMKKYEEINIINKSKELLTDLYDIKEGDYKLKDGILVSSNGSVINKKYYFNGNGIINIDKYGNVKFKINYKNKCINKNPIEKIKLINNKCDDFYSFKVDIVKNNSKISFISKEKDLSYKISYNDDFKGKWNDIGTDNLLLKYYREGKNYIWFKNKDGNLSEKIEFEVECLDTKKAKYNKDVFYCSGSTVIVDNIEWVVIEDSTIYTKLMKYLPIDDKLSHCFDIESEYCFYTKNNRLPYKWSNSYINYYLNNIFINKLSDGTLSHLVNNSICNDFENHLCDNEICGGYSKEEIEYNNFVCNSYVDSKIKLISYDEFNYVYSRTKDKKVINGNYWAINTYTNDKGSSIQYNYDYYILEDLINKLDIKPVIILSKE